MKSAAKVGVLLVVFVILIIASLAVLGRSLLPSRTKTFYVDLNDAGGVTLGTRVLMAGVQIGSVDKVDLVNSHRARFTLRIHPDVQLPKGSELVIPSSLVGLGD